MKKAVLIIWVATVLLLLNGSNAFSGDLTCYGYTSTTSHFACGTYGNCVWWAAYKRLDIAAAISGSGWNGDQWYDNLENDDFDVGSVPKVGAIAAFSNEPVGHVAYVTGLGANGSFSVSEMDYYGTFGSGVQNATYSPDGGTYKRNGSGSWTLQGFIYRRTNGATNSYCDSISSIWGICWEPSSTDISCQGGSDWTLYDFEQGSVIRVSTNRYCLKPDGTGGGIPSDPPDTQDSTPDAVNLTLDFDILDPNTMNELYAGQNTLQQGQAVQLNVQLEAEQGNAEDWMEQGKDTIETDFYVRINDGEWSKIAREYTQASDLDEGDTHTEHILYTIPKGVRNISFYVKTDAEKELTETDEGDNVSRIEDFRIDFGWLVPIIKRILN